MRLRGSRRSRSAPVAAACFVIGTLVALEAGVMLVAPPAQPGGSGRAAASSAAMLAAALPRAATSSVSVSSVNWCRTSNAAPQSCNATVNFGSGLACAGLPIVDNGSPVRSMVLRAPWSYWIQTPEFCGTSIFYNWTTTGGVIPMPALENATSLNVLLNGSVSTNYLTEPAGMFPVMFVAEDWYSLSGINWTASVGQYHVFTDEPTAVVAVPNGTYNVSVTGRFCGPEGLSTSIVVNGTGALLTFQSYCSGPIIPWPLPMRSTPSLEEEFAAYDPLLVVFVMFAGVGLAITAMIHERRRKV